MTKEKVLEAIGIYRAEFVGSKIGKTDYPHDMPLACLSLGLEHCHGMLDKMEEFVEADKMEKVFRWLGFIQGVLWAQGIHTLDTLKNHNRADPE